jgi:hypothetical protein
MWNQGSFQKVFVRDGRIDGHDYEEPFASLPGSHKAQIVVLKDRCANHEVRLRKSEARSD